ncbi:MAG: hypothetical protein F4W90_07160 [Gammaproteobacteria bacterium]|nr:hypothetical protein [Gammaproteobacteria bacterium]
MARRPNPRAITNTHLTANVIDQKVKEFVANGKEIEKVQAGATGQDEKNRSKHIVISRKPPQAPPGLNVQTT